MGAKQIALDDTDLAIINLLYENSRISFTEMSKMTGLPDATLQHRFKRLVKNKVIKRFTVELSHAYTGHQSIALVLIKTMSDKHDEAKTRLASFPEIEEVYEVFGEFDLVIKIAGKSLEGIDDIIRDKISTIHGVRELRKMPIVEEIKDVHTNVKNALQHTE